MGEVIYAPVVCTLYLYVLRRFANYIRLDIELPAPHNYSLRHVDVAHSQY